MLGIEVITGSELRDNELQYTLLILELVRPHIFFYRKHDDRRPNLYHKHQTRLEILSYNRATQVTFVLTSVVGRS